jgi:hypothetical protein
MLTVACVLKSGGEYTQDHVRHLRDGVARHLALEHRFVCLTDTPMSDVHSILLQHDWPGWWSKIELWRPGLFDGPVIYLDLDTVICRPIDDIVLGHRFTVLRNMWVADGHPRIGSGLMAWNADLSAIYETFRTDPPWFQSQCVTKDNWGDQGFIQRHTPIAPERWQTRHPGRVVSFKRECQAGVPPRASIICFHGQPRPWTTPFWDL